MDPLQDYDDLWVFRPPEILIREEIKAKEYKLAIGFIKIECGLIAAEPPEIIIKIPPSSEIRKMRMWCRDNLKDKHVLVPYSGLWCCFWNRRDAMHFRLVWGNGDADVARI